MTRLVKPKNSLKAKVGHGGFKEEDLKKAQIAIEENKVDFKPIALGLLGELDQILLDLKSGKLEISASGKIMDPLMQLRAQGSLFHYASITRISDVVVDFLDGLDGLDDHVIEILSAYKNAGTAILALEIHDKDDAKVAALVKELQNTCKRYHDRISK